MALATIDLSTVRNLLKSMVEDFGPDHTARNADGSTGCIYFYVKNNALIPVCIVGTLFARLGILRALVSEHETSPVPTEQYEVCTPGFAMWQRAESMGVEFTDEAQAYCRSAQSEQDQGRTWAEAVKFADREVEQRIQEEARARVIQALADAGISKNVEVRVTDW